MQEASVRLASALLVLVRLASRHAAAVFSVSKPTGISTARQSSHIQDDT